MSKFDTEQAYSTTEWKESVEQAVNSNFNRTMSYLSDWPASVWLIDEARQYIVHHHIGTDVGELLEAVANLIEDECGMDSPYSADKFMRVLKSFNGSTKDDFEELIREHAYENGTPEMLLDDLMRGIDDPESWYFRKVAGDNEVCADTNAGGTLFWFKKDQW